MAENIENKGKNVFDTWVAGYTSLSNMWKEYYTQIYKPWINTTEELLEKATQVSKNPTTENYKEFYEAWMKIYSPNVDKIQEESTKYNKELLEKILTNAERSTELYKAWISELDENSKKTIEILRGEDITKYKDIYDLWISTYGKIFEGFLALPLNNLKNIYEVRTGLPDTYTDSFIQMSKVWQDSYTRFYKPWIESIDTLSKKSIEISKGSTTEESYKEFYSLWIDMYKKTYGKMFSTKFDTKKSFENFMTSNDVYINLYKSWINAIEKLNQKMKDLSTSGEIVDAALCSEYFRLWIKTYEKFFDSFFENTPTLEPFKEALDPIKTATKIYLDTFSRMIDMYMKFYFPYVSKKGE